jgi:hypothetical protein
MNKSRLREELPIDTHKQSRSSQKLFSMCQLLLLDPNAYLSQAHYYTISTVYSAYSQSSSLSSAFFDSFGLLGAWLVLPEAAPTTS